MFGGIGSAIVALNQNSIAIRKVIHVEHDKVGTHVYKWNHDPEYDTGGKENCYPTLSGISKNGNLNDGVPMEHEFYATFEAFYKSYKERNRNMRKTFATVIIPCFVCFSVGSK